MMDAPRWHRQPLDRAKERDALDTMLQQRLGPRAQQTTELLRRRGRSVKPHARPPLQADPPPTPGSRTAVRPARWSDRPAVVLRLLGRTEAPRPTLASVLCEPRQVVAHGTPREPSGSGARTLGGARRPHPGRPSSLRDDRSPGCHGLYPYRTWENAPRLRRSEDIRARQKARKQDSGEGSPPSPSSSAGVESCQPVADLRVGFVAGCLRVHGRP